MTRTRDFAAVIRAKHPKLAREAVLSLPAGAELDGLVDSRVWGIDRTANTAERRALAIFQGRELGHYGDPDRPAWFIFAGHRIGLMREAKQRSTSGEHWVWEQRHGKPWQAALEAHVTAWRAPPSRPWSTDVAAAWEVVEKLREHFTNIALHASNGWGLTVWWIGGDGIERNIVGPINADTAAHAIALTAIFTTTLE